MIFSPDGGRQLLFIEVPDDKQVKNRVHLDLKPAEGPRDEEVARLLRLGARQLADHRREDGTGWVTLADPEGNEFCVVRSDAERAASAVDSSRCALPVGSGWPPGSESSMARTSKVCSPGPSCSSGISSNRSNGLTQLTKSSAFWLSRRHS